jgi:hypothetical protein
MSNHINKDEHISFFLDEVYESSGEADFDFSKFANETNNTFEESVLINHYNELIIPKIVYYQTNYTVKELMLICEYYGISKEIKLNKFNKEDLITFLVNYEIDPCNEEIVNKRQNMWFYINELKNDKFMKKFILW